MSDSPKILAFGEVLWDLLPTGPRLGGAPANFAMQAASQGATAYLYSAVGVDDYGRDALALLQQRGVMTSMVDVIPAVPTGTVGVTLDANAKPTFVINAPAAWDEIAWQTDLESQLSQFDAVYYGTLGQRGIKSRETLQHLLSSARRLGIKIVFDINLRAPFYDESLIKSSIASAHVLKLSDDELPVVAKAYGLSIEDDLISLLQTLRQRTQLEVLVLTCGAQGAIAVTVQEVVKQPGIKVKVVNTVGAGDAFTACFTVGWLKHMPLTQVMLHACEVAAQVCTQI